MRTEHALGEIESELKKRLRYPYIWGRRQGNLYNGMTRFIYNTFSFNDLLKTIDREFKGDSKYDDLFNYALNRWYNFWSAEAIVRIMCSHPKVEAAMDERDRLVDLTIDGIPFDHKTSVFPRNYVGDIAYARKNPIDLIEWLYSEQSQEQRHHMKNRLFLVLYSPDGNHWKLKADISWLKGIVDNYMAHFSKDKLQKLSFDANTTTLSDIIWAVKGI